MTASRRILIGIVVLSGLWSHFGATRARADIYDAAADFSATSNPNGVWSYGYSITLGSAFHLDVTNSITSTLDLWEGIAPGSGGVSYPVVAYNGTGNTITLGTAQYLAGQLGAHPGPQDQYSVIRFTAPDSGTFTLTSSFTGLDFAGPTTTDVHVLLDGSSIFNGAVDGFGPGSASAFSTTLTLQVGDTVDFAVGYGSNGTYLNDSTGIAASLTTVPEPTSFVLAAIATIVITGYEFCRRWQVNSSPAQLS